MGMGKLQANLFGMPVVYWQGERVVFPFAKLEALFYYLLVKKQATREELAALLWSDSDEATAKKNLRNAVYLLKKLIADEFILTPSRTVVYFNPAISLDLDVDNFVSREPSNMENTEYCKACADLYQGEFLHGFALKDALFEEWVIGQRDFFEEIYTNRLKQLITALLRGKQYGSAKTYLKNLIQIDEYNESAYRTLMKVYVKEGAFNKALDIYHCLKSKLDMELGIRPDASTTELYQQIKCKKTGCHYVEGNGCSPGDVFFGRERELDMLRKNVRSFIKGSHSSLILVCGEQGVGKTALMKRLFGSVNLGDSLFLEAQCYQAETKYPFKPWNGIFRIIAHVLQEQQVQLAALWRQVISYIFPAVADSAAFCPNTHTMFLDVMNYHMAEEVMVGVLNKAAGARKIIIFFDDIQWIDDNSLLLIKHMLLDGADKFLVIATCRNEKESMRKIDAAFAELERNKLVKLVEVRRFTYEEVETFSALMLPAHKVTPRLMQSLYEQTEGNALYLVECLNLIMDGQNIANLSPHIQSILKDRVLSLSPKGQKVLNIASMFFDEVHIEQVLPLSSLNEMELVEIMEELQERNLLFEVADQKSGKPAYKFSHIKIRDYVYSQLSLARRRMLHDKIGEMIEAGLKNNFQDRAAYSALLYHFSNAGNKIKVLEYTVKIAEGYSYVSHELFPQISDNDLYAGGNLFIDPEQAVKYLHEIESIITNIKNEDGYSAVLCRFEVAYLDMLGRYFIWQDEYRKGIYNTHRMIRLAAKIGDYEHVVKGYQQIVYYGIRKNNAQMIEGFACKIIKTAEQYNLEDKRATALRFLGVACAMRREYAVAEKCYRQSIALFKQLEDNCNNYTLSIAAAYNYIGDLRRFDKEFTAAIEYYEQAIQLCKRKNIFKGLSVFYTNAGHAAFDMGEYGKARIYLEEAVNIHQRLGAQWGHSTLKSLLALIAVREGRRSEALELLIKAENFSTNFRDIFQRGMVLRAKAEIRAIMERDLETWEVFKDYLTCSAHDYCRKGRDMFAKLGDCYEISILDDISDPNSRVPVSCVNSRSHESC